MDKSFIYDRTIKFRDTDAAGVVYFANGLSICHEAYEASLAASGINLKAFFSGEAIAVPITHASIDFFKPMFCGDRIAISLISTLLSPESFQIDYQLYFDESSTEKKAIAKAITKHTCIDTSTRKRCNLSDDLLKWMEFTQ
ncbi:MAG: 1,4-dihydroxy-2-naphthoyl-CoA hydrolase [Pseudanabaena frigida]|uniref:1,4-dihydroxy-2-naphthoyl-CoA hydrolase n=1 Tax=Pseudanabaena frigida TaxID=945775 RepID=A0A2W4Y8D0_9CYAN|nr:MAG: 1,4-dihydroxy-2-naphthoyl-CoA hydrolase [Pseudanabaena frigida]